MLVIEVVKEITGVRRIIRGGKETLWWGHVKAARNIEEYEESTRDMGFFHAFATTKEIAEEKIIAECERRFGTLYKRFVLVNSIYSLACEPHQVDIIAE